MDTTLVNSMKAALKESAKRWHELNNRCWDAMESGDADQQNSMEAEKLTQRMLASFAWNQLKRAGIDTKWPIA
jgi:hypothetical protein